MKIEAAKTELAQSKDALEQLEDRESAYQDTLSDLEEVLRGGGRLFPDHGKVIRAAVIGGKEREDVIADLRELNPEVPDHAFVDRREDPTPWNGVRSSS